MYRSIRLFLLLPVAISLLALSCNETNVAVYGSAQMPLSSFTSAITYSHAVVDDPINYEFGSSMEFLKNGRITQLYARIPDNGAFRVSLWDLVDTSLVVSVEILADSGQVVFSDITDINVDAGAEYSVTVNSNDYYIWNKGGFPAYPSWAGDVRINGYGYIADPVGLRFPDEFPGFYYAGLADLVFEAKLE